MSVLPSSVVGMGEALELWDSHRVAAAAAGCVRAERAAGCRLLELAALWADHHPADGILHQFTDLAIAGEETARFGGDGTPEVAEFAPAELGVEIGLSPGQARALIADALDLRHRLPRLWGRVQAGQVPARDARRVAARTRLLSVEQAMVVDRRVVRVVGQLSWTRLEHLLAAEILRVDRVRVEQETENAKRFRYVRTGQGSEYGLTEVSMLVDTPDAILLKAATKRLAEVLMGRADDLPAGVPDRGARSKAEWQAVAAGILAQPALALQVLAAVDQPDLFTDLEAHLQVAARQPGATELPAAGQPRPDLPMPDRPIPGGQMPDQPVPGGQMPGQPVPGGQMPGQPVPGGQMPDQPIPGGQMADQQMPAQPMADRPRPDQPMPDLPDPGWGLEPSDSDLADFEPGPPAELPASDLPGPDLPMPAEPASEDPRPGLDPQPEAEPSEAERREAVMKDLARRIDPEKLTPRVVLHVHIGADALPAFNRGAGSGCGPGRGHRPGAAGVGAGMARSGLPGAGSAGARPGPDRACRWLRDPRPDGRGRAGPVPGQRVPLVRHHQPPPAGPGPHRALHRPTRRTTRRTTGRTTGRTAQWSTGRATRADPAGQPRSAGAG